LLLSRVSNLGILIRWGDVSYASASGARVEWVGRRGLAGFAAEGTLRDGVAVAVEGEGDLVADGRFDALGCEGEAVFGDLDLVDAVHGLAMMLAMLQDQRYTYVAEASTERARVLKMENFILNE
jgi:hypothetical protein